jgi:hypothetical protein
VKPGVDGKTLLLVFKMPAEHFLNRQCERLVNNSAREAAGANLPQDIWPCRNSNVFADASKNDRFVTLQHAPETHTFFGTRASGPNCHPFFRNRA